MKSMFSIREGGPASWALRLTAAAMVAFVVLWIPTRTGAGTIQTVIEALVLMSAAMALNILLGYTGQISIGHSAFLGMGAYTTGILVSSYGWNPWLTFPVAFIVSFILGVIVSFPASRITGVYLALVTLSLALVFPQVATWKKLSWLTGGGSGLPTKDAVVADTGFNIGAASRGQMQYFEIFGWDPFGDLRKPDNKAAFWYWIAMGVVVIVYLVARGMIKSRVGRSMVAIRDNETAAAVMGVNVVRTKALVFGISAGLCALPGCVTAIKTGGVSPEGIQSMTVRGAITFLIVMVVGGAGSLWGPIVGGAVYVFITDKTGAWSDEASIPGLLRPLFGWAKVPPSDGIFAILLIVLMFVAPRGLVGVWRQYSPRIVRVLPRPAGAVGPATMATVAMSTSNDSEGEHE